MRIQIDTIKETIKMEGSTSLNLLIDFVTTFFPDNFGSYNIEIHVNIDEAPEYIEGAPKNKSGDIFEYFTN